MIMAYTYGKLLLATETLSVRKTHLHNVLSISRSFVRLGLIVVPLMSVLGSWTNNSLSWTIISPSQTKAGL